MSAGNPHQGTPSPTLLACDEIVAPQISGFCECSNGTKVAHSTCDHDPFTCHQKCTEGAARFPPFSIDKSCHHFNTAAKINELCHTGLPCCAFSKDWDKSWFEHNKHQGDYDPCPKRKVKKKLHMRMTCEKKEKKKKRKKSVGEVCRSTTDALKLCMEHHIVAEAIKCQNQYNKVLECQSTANKLVNKNI